MFGDPEIRKSVDCFHIKREICLPSSLPLSSTPHVCSLSCPCNKCNTERRLFKRGWKLSATHIPEAMGGANATVKNESRGGDTGA